MNSDLPPTLTDGDFASVFQEVQHAHSMGLPNGEDLRLFHLNVRNNQFSYSDLESFIQDHVGRYVLSRAEIQEYVAKGKEFSVNWDAVRRLAPSTGEGNNVLGEILLWAFLEQILRAPKVMSKIELNRLSGVAQSQADAIHLQVDATGQTSANIVFGTSNVVSDLRDAIDEAFERVVEIENNSGVECQLAEATVFEEHFDPSVTTTLREMLVPQPGGQPQYNTAYGLFLAYNVGLLKMNYTTDQYAQALAAKMDGDIEHNTQYIVGKINSLNLTNHAFYIYVLPLDDAVKDKAEIISRALGMGGGHSGT